MSDACVCVCVLVCWVSEGRDFSFTIGRWHPLFLLQAMRAVSERQVCVDCTLVKECMDAVFLLGGVLVGQVTKRVGAVGKGLSIIVGIALTAVVQFFLSPNSSSVEVC